VCQESKDTACVGR